MCEEFIKRGNAYVLLNDQDEVIAEITYEPKEGYVVANHTFVDSSLRGQGIAGKLLDHLVREMEKEGKLIEASCSYVVRQFAEKPEKYDFINKAKH